MPVAVGPRVSLPPSRPTRRLQHGALQITLVAVASLGAPGAWAGPLALSQEQAVARALERHPAIEAAARAVDVADARQSEVEAAWLPRLKAEASYMLVGPLQELTIDTGIQPPGSPAPISIQKELGSLHNASGGATLAWRALDFGVRIVQAQAAEALARAERAQGEAQKAEIAYAVRAAYLGARFFHEMESVTSRSLAVAEDELRDRTLQRKAGIGSDLDLARIEMRVAELRAQQTRARQERGRLLTALRLLVGAEPRAELTLSDDLRRLGTASVPGARSTADSPARQRMAALAEAADLEGDRLWWQYWPTVDLVGTVKYQYPKNYFETDTGGMAYSAGAVWSWTIFDGDLIRRQRVGAEAKAAQLRAQDRAIDQDIQRKQAEADAQVATAEAASESAARTKAAAETYLRAAKASLDAGSGTALEVRQATDAVDQAELAALKAYFDAALARAAALLAQGRALAKEEARP
jgi:outer membrane protein TolC